MTILNPICGFLMVYSIFSGNGEYVIPLICIVILNVRFYLHVDNMGRMKQEHEEYLNDLRTHVNSFREAANQGKKINRPFIKQKHK